MDISIVIALLNEEESLKELVEWIDKSIGHLFQYEVIMIDDGSTDGSWKLIKQFAQELSSVKGIRFRRNYGKSAALNEGFKAASGRVVITMDADLQDSPEEIPELHRMITEEGYDIVSGWKKKRHDPLTKTIPTKLYNKVTRIMSGIQLHDMNCGLKAYRQEVIKNIEVYGDMHRYIPVIAKWAGYNRIGEKVVQHQARKHGHSKFGLSRFVYGPLDLASILFVGKYGKRPMHFFGSWGLFFFFLGFLVLVYLSMLKLIYGVGGISNRPLFFFGIVTLIVGTQLYVTGFLAELISRNSVYRNDYNIAEKIGISEISMDQ